MILAVDDAGAAQGIWHHVLPYAPLFSVGLATLSICIAVAAFSVAFRNFRLSRYPHVRLVFNIYYSKGIENPQGAYNFDVEVESWGLPIWDVKVMLVADHSMGYEPPNGTSAIELVPVGTLQNPMNAGQVVKFRTTAGRVQGTEAWGVNKPHPDRRHYGMSDLPEERVALVVYGSGERVVKRVTSAWFGEQFWMWDVKKNDALQAKYKRQQSKWRRYSGLNLLDRFALRRLRPILHAYRKNRAHAKFMRDIMKKADKAEAKSEG
jgi:hypothetical protein